MTTKIPAELSSTPGITDSSNATAITIDSSEKVGLNGLSAGDYWSTSNQLVLGNTTSSANGGMTIATANNAVGQIYFADDTSGDARYRGQIQYTHVSDAMDFATAASFRMRIDSVGRVGIGTSSPDAMLKIVSNSNSYAASWVRGDQFGLRVSAGSSSSHYALRVANSSDSSLMTVNGDGKVMIGGTSPSALFQVNGTVAFSHAYSSNATALNITNTVGTNNYFAQAFYSSSSLAGYIFVASSTNTTQYATSGSDLSFKENIKDWDENVLDKFKNIKPVTFNFKSDETKEEIKGYIAQNEVDKFPEAYPKNPTDEKHWFNPSGMTVYLMKAIKEQQDIIEDLKSRIETLEG